MGQVIASETYLFIGIGIINLLSFIIILLTNSILFFIGIIIYFYVGYSINSLRKKSDQYQLMDSYRSKIYLSFIGLFILFIGTPGYFFGGVIHSQFFGVEIPVFIILPVISALPIIIILMSNIIQYRSLFPKLKLADRNVIFHDNYDIFVSHSSVDKSFADKTVQLLEGEGIKCWVAPRNIKKGEKWADAIMNGLQSSKAMVLIFSATANASEHVQREIAQAFDTLKIPVIPFRIENIAPSGSMSYYLDGVQWHDAFIGSMDERLLDLLNAAKEVIAR